MENYKDFVITRDAVVDTVTIEKVIKKKSSVLIRDGSITSTVMVRPVRRVGTVSDVTITEESSGSAILDLFTPSSTIEYGLLRGT